MRPCRGMKRGFLYSIAISFHLLAGCLVSEGVERSGYAGQMLPRGYWEPRSIMMRLGRSKGVQVRGRIRG